MINHDQDFKIVISGKNYFYFFFFFGNNFSVSASFIRIKNEWIENSWIENYLFTISAKGKDVKGGWHFAFITMTN